MTIQNELVFIHMAQPMTNSSPVGGCWIPRGHSDPGSCLPHGPETQAEELLFQKYKYSNGRIYMHTHSIQTCRIVAHI